MGFSSTIARYATVKKHLIRYYIGGADTISKSLPRWVRKDVYISKE